MRPDRIETGEAGVRVVLARTSSRIRTRHAVRAMAAAAAIAAGLHVALTLLNVPGAWRTAGVAAAALATALILFRSTRRQRTRHAAAAAVEQADPSLRNLLVTAAQLLETPGDTRPYMRARVLHAAAARAGTIDPGKAVPLFRDGLILAGAVAAFVVAALVRVPAQAPQVVPGGLPQSPAARMDPADFVIELTPPAYTGRPASRLVNPATLDVLGGTHAVMRPPAAPAASIRVNGAPVSIGPDGRARTVLTESGYLAVDAGAVHRLVPLTVTPDRAPDVRMIAPAKDLRVPSTAVSIPLRAEARDDLGLASLELRYTVVSGTGEQFSFTEGTLPATIARGSDRSWTLEGALSLARLKLEPGDALIYRAVAVDRRPGGTGTGASDTFFVEIAGPGDVPLEGVEMPPDKERYALSQAMIVLKLERLRAREQTMSREARAEAAGNIAAEQRAVRANFIFLLGGEVEDEEAEAEASHEISEGRLVNQARREIVSATILMGDVEKALAAVATGQALPPARAAVKALQRAFGHSRYLLRALPSRVRIDPARRLSGDVSAAADWDRALAPPAPDAVTEAARGALTDLVAVSAALDGSGDRAMLDRALLGLGERLLAAAAAAPDLQGAAREVAAARDALASGRLDAAREALRRAAGPLVARAQHGRLEGSRVPGDASRLAGAAAVAGRGGTR